LLSVHCDDEHWVKRAEEVLKRTGGEDISSSSEASADFAASDKPMPRNRASIVEEPLDPLTPVERIDEPRTRTAGGTTIYEP
ncbi:MAG TPA: hypothetical protein VHB50_15260, partial [Bryobacteraceae bacterium]|nr:hypothetical protein [Bryobacteraceae bacterium]